jgi:hypothetical protein
MRPPGAEEASVDLRLTLDNLLVITVVAVIAPDAPGGARTRTFGDPDR